MVLAVIAALAGVEGTGPLGRPAAAQDAAAVSTLTTADRALNPHVLAVLREYPTDGSFGYHWPQGGGWEGATRDVVWRGRKLCSGDPQHRSYCCGLTYEVWVRALLASNGGHEVDGLDGAQMHEARLRFFGDSKEGERKRLVQFALESMKLGEPVPLEQARAGDFVQLWRHDGSGHQAIVVNLLWKDDQPVGLTYWSSQPSTRGIGYRSESFGETGHAIDKAQVHVARAWLAPRR